MLEVPDYVIKIPTQPSKYIPLAHMLAPCIIPFDHIRYLT